jgi:hypothetical protein
VGQHWQQRQIAVTHRVFRLDRRSSTWHLVHFPKGELYGAGGSQLVFADWTGGIK